MKKLKFFVIILGLSFALGAMGVNAWSIKSYIINFSNWGTQTIYTSYEIKDSALTQSWETVDVTNGGNLEVVLQDQSAGTITDGLRIYLSPGSSYAWKTYLSKITGNNYRLKFIKNGFTIGMTTLTGWWNKN